MAKGDYFCCLALGVQPTFVHLFSTLIRRVCACFICAVLEDTYVTCKLKISACDLKCSRLYLGSNGKLMVRLFLLDSLSKNIVDEDVNAGCLSL